jgi:SAM-dependent methyltransferase
MQSFDHYAHDYNELLDDPLRQKFAGDAEFFIHQKCRALLRHLGRGRTSKKWRLLDAGCGQGTALQFLLKHARVIGTDISLPMVRAAVGRGPVAVQEPFDLPFADGTFDAAFAFCVYHHLDTADHVRHLQELKRVVAPGGHVCIFEHNPYNPVTRLVFARAKVDQGCHMIVPRNLRATFRAAGLEQIEQEYILFLPESVWKRAGAIEPSLAWLPLGGQYFVSGRKPRAAA